MPSVQIRPNRLEINDRFPMLGFTLRTSGQLEAEIAIATDRSLLQAENREKRTSANFASSRAFGPITLNGPDTVYLFPPEVIANFVGKSQLFFGVATRPLGSQATFDVDAPTATSPYISLQNLSGRTLRPSLGAGGMGAKRALLEWAGDVVKPGLVPANGASGINGTNGAASKAPAPKSIEYNDGFGVLPSPPASPAVTAPAPASTQALRRANGVGVGQDIASDLLRGVFNRVAKDVPAISVRKIENAFEDSEIARVLEGLPEGLRKMIERARQERYALAFGTHATVATATAGVGAVFDTNGDIGVYYFGGASFDESNPLATLAEILANARADVQLSMMVVSGSMASLSAVKKSLGVSLGEEVVGSLAGLFTGDATLLGIELGIGAGFEFQIGDYFKKVRAFLATATESGIVQAQAAGALGIRQRSTPLAPRSAELGLWDVLVEAGAQDVPAIQVLPLGDPLEYEPVKAALEQLPWLQKVAESARSVSYTLAAGQQFALGSAAAGAGVAFDTSGNLALYYYGAHGLDLDDLAGSISKVLGSLGASATIKYIAISGNVSSLSQVRKAIGATLGEEIVGGAYALFDASLSLKGFAFEAGIGAELEVGSLVQKLKQLLPTPVRKFLGLSVLPGFSARSRSQGLLEEASSYAVGVMSSYPAPSIQALSAAQLLAVRAALTVVAAPMGIGGLIAPILPECAKYSGYTLALGYAGDAAGILQGRVGCVFGRSGGAALYYAGQASLDAEQLVGLLKKVISDASVGGNAALQLTILDGELDDLTRLAYHAGIKESAVVDGVPLVGGLDVLFDGSRTVKGVTLDLGVGFALELKRLKDLPRLLRSVRALPAVTASAGLAYATANEATDDLLAQAGTVDPACEDRLRNLISDNTLSTAQLAQIVAFIQPDDDKSIGSEFKGGSASTPPEAQAASLAQRVRALKRPAKALASGSRGKISWKLDCPGLTDAPLQCAETTLENWPVASDGTALPLRIRWQFDAKTGAVGGVAIDPGEPHEGSSSLHVVSAVGGPRKEGAAQAIPVAITYVFSGPGAASATAATQLVLHGDGTYDRNDSPQNVIRAAS